MEFKLLAEWEERASEGVILSSSSASLTSFASFSPEDHLSSPSSMVIAEVSEILSRSRDPVSLIAGLSKIVWLEKLVFVGEALSKLCEVSRRRTGVAGCSFSSIRLCLMSREYGRVIRGS